MSRLQAKFHRPGRKVEIFINGRACTAHEGETVLAALIASGYKALRKSRKREEPRGPLCGMGVCYECLVTINRQPNQKACMTQVEERMEVLTHDA
jgi:sarcosine oxidase subunit alpha